MAMGTDDYFKLATEHFKTAGTQLVEAEESLRKLRMRLETSLERLGKLRRNESIYAELEEILSRGRAGGFNKLQTAES